MMKSVILWQFETTTTTSRETLFVYGDNFRSITRHAKAKPGGVMEMRFERASALQKMMTITPIPYC